MRLNNIVLPAVWEIENDPALHKKYRLDFSRVADDAFNHVRNKALEVLPILVRYGSDQTQLQEVLDYVGYAQHLNVIHNPFVASIENAVYLDSRTAFYKRFNDPIRAQ